MLKRLSYLSVLLVLLNCNSSDSSSEKKPTIVDGTSRYEVYQSSEMSALMKGMYAYNEQLKAQVKAGKITLEFPEAFMKIHSAELSENKGRTETFDYYSGKFVEAQQAVFSEDSIVPIEERYNNAINMCLSCHKTECTGPIPKIKKLLIK